MKIDHFIYQWEREAVRLRYFEDLTRQQIADRLGMRFAQVKYIFSKPNVRHYIRTQVLPSMWQRERAEIEGSLADPVGAYIAYLVECTRAQTYQWLGPGEKVYSPDNRRQFQALNKIGRIYGLTHYQRTVQRDLEKAIRKHTQKLIIRRELLLFKWRHSTS